MKILVIEDDEVLLSILVQSLSSQHYVIDTAKNGQIGWEYAESTSYNLILLDVGLPKIDGITLCKKLRDQNCNTPILLMTAKDASTERIRGLDAGADDYLIKPLDLTELQARVRALLRRGNVTQNPVLALEALRLDPSSCQVTYKGKLLELTPKEYNLLELFLRNPARVFSRSNIIEHLWTFDDPPQEESVKAHIKGLRQKLKAAGAVDWIENVYGLGYRLNVQSRANSSQEIEVYNQAIASSNLIRQTSTASPNCVEQQFDRARDQLWQQYQGLMAERLAILQNAASAISAKTLSVELQACATSAAHKLAGVLGMFAKEEGGAIAREIEQLLLEKNLSPTQKNKFLFLVQNLSSLLALEPKAASPLAETAQLLLIDQDLHLGSALQELALLAGKSWQQITTLERGNTWLQASLPNLVVISIDAIAQQQESLALVAELSRRTPPIPVIVTAATDELIDRVAVARAGGQGFLVKPVTAAQIWDLATQLLQRTDSLVAKVLVVDDDPVFLAALRPMLEPWGIHMTGLDDPLGFWQVLQSVQPDLLLLDVEMPQISGIELCQAVRSDPTWQELPILFLTAHRDSETIQKVFAIGADDYIIKPVVGAELLNRLTNRLERTRLLKIRSTQDPLTKLANQSQSSRELEQLIQQSAKANCPFCLVLLSAAELRQINIQYSHKAGDRVLQRWGYLFQSALGAGELLGYWSNGEFILALPGLIKQQASERLSPVLTTLRQQIFTAPDGNRFQVTCNLAIAEYPADGTTVQSLYQVASAMAQPKGAIASHLNIN